MFIAAAGVHDVWKMADGEGFALMMGMGGFSCGLVAGYFVGLKK